METNYSLLMAARMSNFKAVLADLPLTSELSAELLIMSCGAERGHWSYQHVFTPGETMYFIFRKTGWTEGAPAYWECVDRELNELMGEADNIHYLKVS